MRNVQQIQASESAFAAILGDGSVVTWGDAQCGGDSSAVQDQLKNEQQIQATDHAFAAILGDGSVVTWRNDSCAVQDQLKNVQQIQGSQSAFAAIIGDGSVVIWGAIGNGDVSSAVKDQLKNVQQIHANLFGLAAILGDVRGRSGGWCCAGSAEKMCNRFMPISSLSPPFLGGWIRGDLGCGGSRWRQQCCAESAEQRAADPRLLGRFCCNSWRRICLLQLVATVVWCRIS